MNEFERLRKQAKIYKDRYPPGTRVYLNNMDDPYAPVPADTKGTVDFVDDIGSLFVTWDNGRRLALVPGVDSFRKLTPKEFEEEQNLSKPDLESRIRSAASRTTDSARPSHIENHKFDR